MEVRFSRSTQNRERDRGNLVKLRKKMVLLELTPHSTLPLPSKIINICPQLNPLNNHPKFHPHPSSQKCNYNPQLARNLYSLISGTREERFMCFRAVLTCLLRQVYVRGYG